MSATLMEEIQTGQTEKAETPADVAFIQMATGLWVSKAIYVAARLGVADLLADGPKTVEQLAAETGAHAPTLRRLLRALAGAGVFREDAEGRYELTQFAEFLRTDVPGSQRGFALHVGESPSWQAWDGLLESVRTGESAFKRVHGMEVFPYYATHPESNEPFNSAMVELSNVVAAAVTEAYDFSRFRRIADVGGGRGGLLAAILKAAPAARGVVCDQPEVVAGARATMEAAGIAERCEYAGIDFFEGVPEGADAHVLKWIIHDWDDERALTLLRNCHRSLADGGRLLLVEAVVPEGGEPSFSKWMDLQMLVMTGGRERTAAEYRALLAEAGFEMTNVIPTKSPVSIVEAVKAGERS
ncbi:MAG TPA: methyltransferase [Pyrinomonadaceae bacterium]|nr:methyltransferase [Pyrinomonadaceae bacterium]